MKYNEDIDPMVKSIGLTVERYIKCRFKGKRRLSRAIKFVAIDKTASCYRYRNLPRKDDQLQTWIDDECRLVHLILAPFSTEQQEYIYSNWEKLLFKLGPKEISND